MNSERSERISRKQIICGAVLQIQCCVGFTVPTMYDTPISNWKPCKDPAIDDPTSRVPYLLDCRTGHAPFVLVV